MAAFYQTFTTARATEPDGAALQTQLRASDATIGVQHQPGPVYLLKKATAWTAPHLSAAQTAIDTAPATSAALTFTTTSRQKDVLATCALIVRARGIPAWNALTVPQKVTATLAEADVWVTIREFAEANL